MPPKYRKNRKLAVKGYALLWKSKKNSSKRTVAASNCLEAIKKEKLKKGTRRRHHKKSNKINDMMEIKTSPLKSNKAELADGIKYGPEPNLDIYDTSQARIHYIDTKKEVFSAVVIPKEQVLNNGVNDKVTESTIKALEFLHDTEKSTKRSAGKTGTSTTNASYCIFGNKVKQGSHGFSHDLLSECNPKAADILNKFASRINHIVSEFIPSNLLRAISKANAIFNWPTLGKCKFIAALASSINYSAPSHTDDDYTFSAHQLNVKGVKLEKESAVVQHFCFPEYGFAIALRHGDIILFNPHVSHCLSEKTVEFEKNDVHVTTFYLKTAHVGKNDNRLSLTEEQKLYYEMSF